MEYTLSPSDYRLPLTYTILGVNADGKDIVFHALEKQGDIAFPEYYSFDKWEPSGIKKFSKTGPQTITAYWILDTFKITLEKNNNWPNQNVKIKIGQKSFDKFLSVFAPSGSSSEYLGSYHGIPSFDTKIIIENCTVDYDKLPLLAGVVKMKNCKFKMYSNHWESKIKGELHLKNCETELPPVLKGLSVFKKS